MERITKESLNEELNLKLQDAQKGMPANLKVEKGDFIDQIHAIEKEIEDSDIIRKKDEEKLETQTSIRGFYKELDASVYKAIDDSNRQIAKSLENRARRRNTLAKRKEKVEKAQQNFISDLQKRKNEIEKQIEDIENQIAKIESEREELKQLRRNHIEVYRLKVDKDVYQLINKKSREFMQSAREKKEQIKDLETQREGFESDLAILDDFMVEVRDGKKEEKVVEEIIIEEVNPETTTPKAEKPEQETEKLEKVSETPAPEAEKTEEVLEAPVSEPKKSEKVSEAPAKQTEKTEKAPVAPAQKTKNVEENNNKTTSNNPNNNKYVFNSGYGNDWVVDLKAPSSSTKTEEILDKHALEIEAVQEGVKNRQSADPNLEDLENTGKEDEAKALALKEIKVSISNEGKPVYSAIIVDDDKEEVITLDKDIHTKLNSAYVRHFAEVPQLAKYLDPNIAELLMKVDKTYNNIEDTDKSTVEEIIKSSKIKALKRYKELLIGKSEGKLPLIDISYDFSELYNMPTDKDDKRRMKFIQKIAKANYNIGLLKSYEGRPSILERIKQKLSNVFARRITSETIDLDFKSSEIDPSEYIDLYNKESSKNDFDKVEFEKMLAEKNVSLKLFKKWVPEYEPASELREGKPTETPTVEPTTETPVEENKQNDFKEGLKVPQQNLGNSNTTVMPENSENVAEVENESKDHGEYGE